MTDPMQSHFRINDDQWAQLQRRGVKSRHLIKAAPLFHCENSEATKVSLMHYLDNRGVKGGSIVEKSIYKAVKESLSPGDLFYVLEYEEYVENGFVWDDEDDEDDQADY